MSVRHVAFVRAVMHGREGLHRSVIIDTFERAGAASVRTHLTTGNVSFDADPSAIPAIIEYADRAMTDVVGRDIESFVRTLDHLRSLPGDEIFATAPFPEAEERVVSFFHEAPDLPWELPHILRSGRAAVFHQRDREVFSVHRTVDGRMESGAGALERASGQRITTRGWGTIEKILRAH